jgi:hypothetical protein
MIFSTNAFWAILGLLMWLCVIYGILLFLATLRERRRMQEKGACISCRHLGSYASEPGDMRACWNKDSVWHFHLASKEFWKRMKACEYYMPN